MKRYIVCDNNLIREWMFGKEDINRCNRDKNIDDLIKLIYFKIKLNSWSKQSAKKFCSQEGKEAGLLTSSTKICWQISEIGKGVEVNIGREV